MLRAYKGTGGKSDVAKVGKNKKNSIFYADSIVDGRDILVFSSEWQFVIKNERRRYTMAVEAFLF